MIVFRQTDGRYPFLWEDASQPAGRWHGDGEGPVHYFSDTPDGAWAEFLRHEEISDPDDLATIRRQIWAVEIGDPPADRPALSAGLVTGGLETYARCQQEARTMRQRGVRGLVAPTAALVPGGARALRVEDGLHPAEPRDGLTIVIFGVPSDLRGWVAGTDSRPMADLLERVRQL